jgi:hypothetical protein
MASRDKKKSNSLPTVNVTTTKPQTKTGKGAQAKNSKIKLPVISATVSGISTPSATVKSLATDSVSAISTPLATVKSLATDSVDAAQFVPSACGAFNKVLNDSSTNLVPTTDVIVDSTVIEQLEDLPTTEPFDQPVKKVDQIQRNGNGNVKLLYEQYDELFPIENGCISQEQIDDVYCLSFVMPNCKIHLSKLSSDERRKLEDSRTWDELFLREEPAGTYHEMEANMTYFVYVEQEKEQLARDQKNMRKIALTMEGAGSKSVTMKDDGRVMESCSCVYGNPCVDEYGCKDWNNRFAISSANGWKGF